MTVRKEGEKKRRKERKKKGRIPSSSLTAIHLDFKHIGELFPAPKQLRLRESYICGPIRRAFRLTVTRIFTVFPNTLFASSVQFSVDGSSRRT
ncbi:hypothetical protein DNTS_029003 [Danionella cerebrum]|uniref:Uncharacterized protein n=1 Tax=Danionella cerebrum TaxID=2873325 RepID=A0A553QR55_9TELE|nr:hypothetical protein DNTS_029003 [Danionella translucida]